MHLERYPQTCFAFLNLRLLASFIIVYFVPKNRSLDDLQLISGLGIPVNQIWVTIYFLKQLVSLVIKGGKFKKDAIHPRLKVGAFWHVIVKLMAS
jgi:hypothetical protein